MGQMNRRGDSKQYVQWNDGKKERKKECEFHEGNEKSDGGGEIGFVPFDMTIS